MRKITLTLALALASSACTTLPQAKESTMQILTLSQTEPTGKTRSGQLIPAGGFSGLLFKSRDTQTGRVRLWSLTDRGPNTEPVEKKRPFLKPEFNPSIVEFELDIDQSKFQLVSRLTLKTRSGKLLTGLPNSEADEIPVDLHGKELALDPLGVDPEGMTMDENGHFWICEEYRPSLLKVNSDGEVVAKFIPMNDSETKTQKLAFGKQVVKDILPKVLSDRRLNRGFEGLTFHQGYLVASLQSPTSQQTNRVTWLIFDPKNEKSKLVFYPADKGSSEKIGDLHSDGKNILVVDQSKKIHKVEMPQTFNEITEGQLLQKKLLIDLENHSDIAKFFDHEKIEGLTQISPEVFALINDNDFGLTGKLTFSTGIAELQKDPRTEILLIKTAPVR